MFNKKYYSKKIIIVVLVALVMAFSTITAYANPSYTTTTTTRNNIAYNWSFCSQGYLEQNCLAFALGKGVQIYWPWSGNPTAAQAKTKLKELGYKNILDAGQAGALPNTEIYCYVNGSGLVTHFARQVPGTYKARAKWGQYEVFNHTTTNPYKPNYYGPLSFRCSQ